MDNLRLAGRYHIEHLRKNKVIAKFDVDNLVLNTAKALMLNSMFNSASTLPTWCIGIINNTPTPTINPTDTAASHGGWSEYTAVKNASNIVLRPVWTPTTATGNLIASSAPSIINFTAGGTVYGLFIVSDTTVGGSSGLIFSAAAFSSTIAVLTNDQMRVTYSLQI